MLNPYEVSSRYEISTGFLWRRLHFSLLLAWGILPMVFSARQLYYAIENLNHVGRFYAGLIWDGLGEYVVLAMWIACVVFLTKRQPASRIFRSVLLIPALPIAALMILSVVRHLLPGGAFYMPDIVARQGIAEFLIFHLLYAIVLFPMAGYAVYVLADGYRAFNDWRHPSGTPQETTNHGLHTERAW